MDFVKYINTEVGRNASNPLVTTLKLTRGRLTGGFLFFPSGPAGLLHFQARIGVHQLLPFNTDGSYHMDDCMIPFHLRIDLTSPPYAIDLITWNESTTYAHALTVGFFLLAKSRRGKEINRLETMETNYWEKKLK
jgi:hypothetical protein